MFSNHKHLEAQLSDIFNAHHPAEDYEHPVAMVEIKIRCAEDATVKFSKIIQSRTMMTLMIKFVAHAVKLPLKVLITKNIIKLNPPHFLKENLVAGRICSHH